MRRLLALPALLTAACLLPAAAARGGTTQPASTATVPAGFTDALVAGGLGAPTAVASTPDGRRLVTVQGGQLRVVRNDVLLARPALDLAAAICSDGERGLLGVAVDPAFATNSFVYLYWTHRVAAGCPKQSAGVPENRVARYVLRADSTIAPASERVLVDHMPSWAGNHNGGDVHFGRDGLLYISVGDAGCSLRGTGCSAANDNARRLDLPLGKMLRVTRAGAIPAGNPFAGGRRCTAPAGVAAGTTPCAEIYATGFRNPFRFAVASAGAIFVNDVGQDLWEEVDRLGKAKDYGWNRCEGRHLTGTTVPCDDPSFTAPISEYNHSTGCDVISAGAFVEGATWGVAHQGSYLYADFGCGRVFERRPNGSVTVFGTLASPVAFEFRGGALLYTSYANGGELRRIRPA